MKTEFKDYLKDINMSDILVERVMEVFNFYQLVHANEITDIFVTDYLKEDGERVYESLWFFSQGYLMEAKGFMSKDEFDMSPLLKCVSYWSLEKKNYDFQKATVKSRLFIKIKFSELDINAQFKASKENCDYLKNIFHKYILPNFSR